MKKLTKLLSSFSISTSKDNSFRENIRIIRFSLKRWEKRKKFCTIIESVVTYVTICICDMCVKSQKEGEQVRGAREREREKTRNCRRKLQSVSSINSTHPTTQTVSQLLKVPITRCVSDSPSLSLSPCLLPSSNGIDRIVVTLLVISDTSCYTRFCVT